MKIKRLDLLAFGPFTEETLDFSKGLPGLHVVHGTNEAGKSSTLRALKGWLFGIPGQSRDNFVHDHKKMRVGGCLELGSEKEIWCIRRKGNKNTLIERETGEPIGDDALSSLLPGLTEELFSQLHGIDHAGLVEGGQAILEQTGDIGQSLFGAAMGASGRNDLLARLQSQAAELFRPTGHTKVINSATAELKAKRKEQKEALVSVKGWKDLQKAQKAAEEAVTVIDETLASASRQRSKLERFQRVAGVLAERRGGLERRTALGDVLVLPEEFGDQRREALDKRTRASERQEKATGKLETRQAEAQGLEVRQELLDNQETIEALHLQLGAVQTQTADKARQDTKRRDRRRAASKVLQRIRPDLELNDAEQLRPLLNKQKAVASLAESSRVLEQKAAQLDTELADLKAEQEGLQKELDETQVGGGDLVPLKAAVSAARRAGDLGSMLQKALERAEGEQNTCARELSRLGRFEGTLDELASLALPEAATLQDYDREFSALHEQVRDRGRRHAEISRELEEAEDELKTLLRASEVPSLAELEQTRKRRDGGWSLVRQQYVDGQDAGAAAAQFAGDQLLPDAYEQSVTAADAVADRLREDADQVQQRAMLEARLEKARKTLEALAAAESEHAAVSVRLQAKWEAVWTSITAEVGTPQEMKEWLQKVDTLLHRTESLEKALGEVRALDSEKEGHIAAVRTELRRFDSTVEVEGVGLDELLTRSEQLIGQRDAAARRRVEIQKDLQKLEVRLNRAADGRKHAAEELRRWKADWARAVGGLGIGDDPLPAQAVETMERLEELFKELDEADSAQRRIYGMEKNEERFNEDVKEFTGRIQLDMGDQTPEQVVRQLVDQLGKARANAASLEKLETQIHELEEEAAEARLDIHAAESRLAELRAQARVDKDEDMGPVEEKSQQSRRLAASLESLEQQLRQAGDGLGIEELEAEAQDQDPDQAGEELERLRAEVDELRAQRDERRDERSTVINQIAALDGSSKAAEAAEQAEQLVAAIVPDVEQYLRLEIASLMLADQIEKYRKENQTPVLKRAGELFAKLTLGSFSGLRDDLDDKGKPVLFGARPDNSEVGVDGMSEGTRDQLYLALRLATLELQLDSGEPVPFVVDDILVGFDDPRSKACLEVLSELAQKTQVLVFTHHEMVADLAREMGEAAGVFVHELG